MCPIGGDKAARAAGRRAPLLRGEAGRITPTRAPPRPEGARTHPAFCARAQYPFGTLTITSPDDRDAGLALDTSEDSSSNFTVHRGYGGGEFDVVMFEAQPRSTLICFEHTPAAEDIAIGARVSP